MKRVRTSWSGLIAVCRECAGDGKAVRQGLRRAARARLGREVRVIRTSCLDVCPKRGTCVAAAVGGAVRTLVVDDDEHAGAVLAALTDGRSA